MDSCNLRELPLLPLVELRELDLSNNELNMIGSESFAGLKNLEKLILQSSQIAQVEDHAFSNFPSLQVRGLLNQVQKNSLLYKRKSHMFATRRDHGGDHAKRHNSAHNSS